MAPERQRYMHIWLMKYTTRLEGEGKRAGGKHWQERWLTERARPATRRKGFPVQLTRRAWQSSQRTG
jgi:hypothetical protein